ncbi:MAG: DUF3800 domain-containing protein [Terricaulis sp.]
MHAFFDDSGDFKSPGFSYLAGWVSDLDGWNGFSTRWQLLLREHGLPFLHTSDFLSGKGDHRGETRTYEERLRTLKPFIELIKGHVLCGYAIGIDPVAYAKALPRNEKGKREYVAPDEFCMLRVLRWVGDHTQAWDTSDFLECAFDESDKNAGRFFGVWRKLKQRKDMSRKLFTSILFGDDKLIPMLQAADLLGVATSRKLAGELATDHPLARIFDDDFEHLVFGTLVHFELWDAEALAAEHRLRTWASASSEPSEKSS